MNIYLLEEIIKHVLYSFKIINSNFINDDYKSLLSNDFLIPNKLKFEDEEGNITFGNVYACKLSSEQQEIKILLGDCSQDSKEYAMIVHPKDVPPYGLYLSIDDPKEPMLACHVEHEQLSSSMWINCNTYMQATFLLGMESIKDLGLAWSTLTNCENEYNLLSSFIGYHDSFYGE